MNNEVKKPEETPQPKEEGKIVNLFEDTGKFHDEEELRKSYERVAKSDKIE